MEEVCKHQRRNDSGINKTKDGENKRKRVISENDHNVSLPQTDRNAEKCLAV